MLLAGLPVVVADVELVVTLLELRLLLPLVVELGSTWGIVRDGVCVIAYTELEMNPNRTSFTEYQAKFIAAATDPGCAESRSGEGGVPDRLQPQPE